MKITSKFLQKYKEKLLFIGRRGSSCYGLQTNKSDEDFLVVLADDCKETIKLQDDVSVVRESDFFQLVLKMEFHAIEALFNEIYSSKSFNELKDFILRNNSKFLILLKFSYFSALKNQIKQYEKTENKKFFAKTLLYGGLMNSDFNLFKLLSKNNLQQMNSFLYNQYFDVRFGENIYKGDESQFYLFKQMRFNKKYSSQFKNRFIKYFNFIKKLNKDSSLDEVEENLHLIF